VLNCNMVPFVYPNLSPSHWDVSSYSGTAWLFQGGPHRNPGDNDGCYNFTPSTAFECYELSATNTLIQQNVTAPVSGNVQVSIQGTCGTCDEVSFWIDGAVSAPWTQPDGSQVFAPNNSTATLTLGHVTAGSHVLSIRAHQGSIGIAEYIMSSFTFTPDSPWTPAPTSTATSTPAATGTPTLAPSTATAAAQLTLTAIASSFTPTPIPIPGQQETAIPTDTECPGGCAVAQLTQIPGLSTRVLVDTSPFTALQHLSIARSDCAPFGYVQIPMPVIHGTPALGSTIPLSYTWTAPVTHTWDDTHIFSNTALQPCAMVNEIPTFVWDLTYWLSVIMCAVGWFMWLIGFVGRLSGDETING
jgi:hypothetical protein